ncbi:MAG: BRCT domain-containing protein [Enterobacterales bacterium endosymbiont of Blomia tropicalis]|uniref:BRCT domain-containing protein n=1 Tax=Mixta mediterraneensis TaxID=2758443 RepID=UPI0025A7E3B6|nr:BRCT domain-containing protein [Mixta mediterraneensis]MDL4913461.1 BRCT domain-containing protein [Mixta mediterraneensis]
MQTICFTGFDKKIKAELIRIAENGNFTVRTNVVSGLVFLCCGSNAGPSKINKAKEIGATLISEIEFRSLASDIDSVILPTGNSEIVTINKDYSPQPAPITSIHDAHPLLDHLWSAIDGSKRISIIYHGGSNSGSCRDVIPLSLNENFVMTAADLKDSNRAVKSFSIENIEVPGIERLALSDATGTRRRSHKQYSIGKFKDIGEVYLALKDTLDGMGWHVATYEEDGVCIRLDICDYFKNGKPRKTPVVTLYYEPENQSRPYVCKCREILLANTYNNLDNAALMFLRLAHEASSLEPDEIKE